VKLPEPPRHPKQFITQLSVDEIAAFREYGRQCAEAMREECAVLIEQDITSNAPLTPYRMQYNAITQRTADAIRKLEVE
jgi:hypothetical protein